MSDFGRFPFGQPNTVRPARMAAHSDAVVIGVYPSAWHVTWSAPVHHAGDGDADRRGTVKALAVDVEPTVFWDGNADDFGVRLRGWKEAIGFVEGQHGTISPTSPSANGSSGDKVVRHYLVPSELDPARVTFTDVFPVFLVKFAAPNAKRREQGDAIQTEYDRIADRMGAPPSSLPARHSGARLPALAASAFGDRLVSDLALAASPLVITLGEEVWETLLLIPSLRARPPRARFRDLYGDAYGSRGSLTVAGREVAWLPLVHPGLLKGAVDPNNEIQAGPRTVSGWATLHARWASSALRPG